MYPVLFRVGAFEVASFGVLVAVAALVGMWLFSRELRRLGLPSSALDAAIYGVLGAPPRCAVRVNQGRPRTIDGRSLGLPAGASHPSPSVDGAPQ
jgi:membrane associated rhomboid family serine protease